MILKISKNQSTKVNFSSGKGEHEQGRVRKFNETIRSNHPEMFLGKDVLKICSKFTGE